MPTTQRYRFCFKQTSREVKKTLFKVHISCVFPHQYSWQCWDQTHVVCYQDASLKYIVNSQAIRMVRNSFLEHTLAGNTINSAIFSCKL